MKKNIIKSITNFLIFYTFIQHFSGCATTAGLGIGAVGDALWSDYKSIQMHELTEVKPYTPIKVIKNDGEKIQGFLSGFEPHDEKEYMEMVSAYKASIPDEHNIPALGAISIVVKIGGRKNDYLLVGFSYDGIIIKREAWNSYNDVSFDLLKGTELIDSEGYKTEIGKLKKIIQTGRVPVFYQLVVQDTSGSTMINLSDVSAILVPSKKKGMILGLCIGAVIDIWYIIATVNVVSKLP